MTNEPSIPTLLSVTSLSKKIDAITILRDVSFDIHNGEVVGLVGPNGAGKTTLMRTLSGLYEASSGTARIAGHSLGTSSARRSLSLMPEDSDLYPGLSVIEHIRLIDGLNQVDSHSASTVDLLERYGLSDKQDALPHELSQGMRRKLALILALRKGAGLFLLDEPFNGLDPVSARELRQEIKRLADQGCGILLSMHGLGELEKIADRVLVLYGGEIVHVASVGAASGADANSLEDVYLNVVGSIRDVDS